MAKFNEQDVDHYIEVREIYDGWSVAVLKDGTHINRWDPHEEPYRFAATNKFIGEVLRG